MKKKMNKAQAYKKMFYDSLRKAYGYEIKPNIDICDEHNVLDTYPKVRSFILSIDDPGDVVVAGEVKLENFNVVCFETENIGRYIMSETGEILRFEATGFYI